MPFQFVYVSEGGKNPQFEMIKTINGGIKMRTNQWRSLKTCFPRLTKNLTKTTKTTKRKNNKISGLHGSREGCVIFFYTGIDKPKRL